MAVEIETTPEFSVGSATPLFELSDRRTFAVSPDGQQFAVLEPNPEGRAPQRITIVLNWLDELSRLAAGASRVTGKQFPIRPSFC